MITSVRLVDGDNSFSFQDPAWGNYNDIVWTNLKVGSPEIRSAVTSSVGGDGTIDRTRWHGARSVSLEARIAQAPAIKVDALTRFLHPVRRPYLVVEDTDWFPSPRRMMLRADQWTTQDLTNTSSWFRDVQLQWTAPLGVWESFETLGFNIPVDPGGSGIQYPITFPETFQVTGSPGLVMFENPGNARSDWVARLYGPCVGPRITNDVTGESIVFRPDLALGVGEYIEVSSENLTAYANSDPTLSRMHMMDFGMSEWWKIEAGANRIRYNPVNGVDVGCEAWFEFRPTWL